MFYQDLHAFKTQLHTDIETARAAHKAGDNGSSQIRFLESLHALYERYQPYLKRTQVAHTLERLITSGNFCRAHVFVNNMPDRTLKRPVVYTLIGLIVVGLIFGGYLLSRIALRLLETL